MNLTVDVGKPSLPLGTIVMPASFRGHKTRLPWIHFPPHLRTYNHRHLGFTQLNAYDSTKMSSFAPVQFTFGCFNLVSLQDARRDSKIVYRSVAHIKNVPEVAHPARRIRMPRARYAAKLIPLSVAAARPDIKYRREGFEIEESRRHLQAIRSDIDDELSLRCLA